MLRAFYHRFNSKVLLSFQCLAGWIPHQKSASFCIWRACFYGRLDAIGRCWFCDPNLPRLKFDMHQARDRFAPCRWCRGIIAPFPSITQPHCQRTSSNQPHSWFCKRVCKLLQFSRDLLGIVKRAWDLQTWPLPFCTRLLQKVQENFQRHHRLSQIYLHHLYIALQFK